MQAIPLESTGFRVTAGCPVSVRLVHTYDSSNPALARGGRNLDGFAFIIIPVPVHHRPSMASARIIHAWADNSMLGTRAIFKHPAC
jgi:hypothetical protein